MKTNHKLPRLTGRKPALILAALFFFSATLFAEEPTCKSKGGEIKVTYPEFARRMKISGTVRFQVQLTSSGSVREVKLLGGNPVLVSAAQDALKQVKFEGSDSCIVVFQFRE